MKLADLWVKLGLKDESFQKGVDNVKKKTNKLKESFQKLHSKIKQTFSPKQTSKLGGALKKLGGVMAGAFAVKKVFQFGKAAVQAANMQMQAEQKLAQAVSSNGKAVQSTMNDYTKFASELQKVTTVGDETTLQLLQLAETMQSDAPKEAAQGAIALSKAYGIDMNSALKMVVLAQKGEYTMLQRYIPELRSATDEAEKHAIVQKAMGDGFDIAKKEAQTGLGPIQQMKNAWGDVTEIIGKVFLPLIQKVAKRITNLSVWIQDNFEKVKTWGSVILSGASAIGVATLAMKLLNAAFAANPIGLIITALVTLGTMFVSLWKTSETFRAKTKFVAASVASFFQKAWINIKKGAELMWVGIKTYFTAIPKLAKVIWNTIKRVMKGENIGKAFKDEMLAAFKDVQKDVKQVKDKYNKELEKIKTPNYDEILDAEKAKEEGAKAGKAAKKAFEDEVNTGQPTTVPVTPRLDYGKLGSGKMKSKEVEGVTMSGGGGVEMPSMELADMSGAIAQKNEEIKQLLAERLQVWNDFKDRMAETVEAFAEDVVSGFANSMGEMIAAGNVDPGELGKQLLGQIGSLLSSLGKMLISLGIGSEAFQKLLGSGLTNPVSAGLAIAAGAALVAIGAGIKKKASSAASGGGSTSAASGGGGSTSRTRGVGASAEAMNINVNLAGVLKGNDIKLSTDRTNYKNNTIG